MSGPARLLVAGAVALALAGALGLAWWNDPAAATAPDEHYVSLARSDPAVFRAAGSARLRAVVERRDAVVVSLYDGDRLAARVRIHPRSERIERVEIGPGR